MSDKIYLGTGKQHTFDNGGSKIGWACPISDLEAAIQVAKADGQDWLRVDICERREPSEKGATHYGVLNTWKPDGKTTQAQNNYKPQVNQVDNTPKFDEDIPF